MDVHVNDEEYAVKYLLGELTDAQQARLEERFFHDAQVSELFSAAEDDLIDQFARGELYGRQRERFEHHFLISERRRQKLVFARTLLQSEQARTAFAAVPPRKAPGWKAMAALLFPPHRRLSYGLAAFALFALVGGWQLISEFRQMQREVAETNAARAQSERQSEELRQQANDQRRRNDELAARNEQLEGQTSQLKQQVEAANREPRAALSFLTFVLAPGYRSSEGPRRLILPRGIRTVRLQLNLKPDDEYPSYRVKLRKATGEPVRSWGELRASSTAGERAVFLVVPAGLLSTGQYELTLSGVADSGTVEDLGYYYFRLLMN